jgi:hypothetical protein
MAAEDEGRARANVVRMTRAELRANAWLASVEGERSIEDLWRDVLGNWDDDRAHHVLLETCRQRERLGEAARLYRGMLEEGASAYRVDHVKRAQIQRRLKAIGVLAAMSFHPPDEDVADLRRRMRIPFIALAAAVMLAGIAWALLR